MRTGTAYLRQPLVPYTDVIGCSFVPTPMTTDAAESGDRRPNRGANVKKWGGVNSLGAMAHTGMWPTPRSNLITQATEAGASRDDSRLEDAVASTGDRGQLNPTWVEWLMGFPLGWTDLEHSATP